MDPLQQEGQGLLAAMVVTGTPYSQQYRTSRWHHPHPARRAERRRPRLWDRRRPTRPGGRWQWSHCRRSRRRRPTIRRPSDGRPTGRGKGILCVGKVLDTAITSALLSPSSRVLPISTKNGLITETFQTTVVHQKFKLNKTTPTCKINLINERTN